MDPVALATVPGLPPGVLGVTLFLVSTLAEIEVAVDLLPNAEKERLLRFLAIRLRQECIRGPEPRVFSREELAAMLSEDEADGARLREGR